LQKNTYLLWFLPALTIFGMGIWLIAAARRQKPNIETPRQLTEAEQAVLKRVMDDNT
jgi:cytochrome c-type biogenesis protein CcmH/NrfF